MGAPLPGRRRRVTRPRPDPGGPGVWTTIVLAAVAGGVAAVGCGGSRFAVEGERWDGEERCYEAPEVVGEADAPPSFAPDPVCATRPEDDLVYYFRSSTFPALLGWPPVTCPADYAPCP